MRQHTTCMCEGEENWSVYIMCVCVCGKKSREKGEENRQMDATGFINQ